MIRYHFPCVSSASLVLAAMFTASLAVSGGVEKRPLEKPFLPERAGYYDTAWPSEHTDLWRSHAVLGAGLPADFNPNRLAVSKVKLNLPMWGYTRDRNEVFVIGGSPVTLNAFTQSYKSQVVPSDAAFLADILLSTLNPSVPYVAKIRPDSMSMARKVFLTQGTTVNYTGGLLMHQNGYVYAVSASVLYKIHPNSMKIVDSVQLPLVEAEDPFWTTYNGIQVLASGQIVAKGYHFLNSNILGWLLLIDPDDLSFTVKKQKPVFSPRLTIDQTPDGQAWLYHNNATQTLRFEITENDFVLDDLWSQVYRVRRDGTTQASSPIFFGEIGQTVFANSTAPSPTLPFSLFTQPVATPPGEIQEFPAFVTDQAGFNFYMIAADPFLQQLVVFYDPINGLLSAQDVAADGTLTMRWQRDDYRPSASPAICPDRDLLYVDDYTGERDELVVVQLSTGDELARVPLDATEPTVGTIFLGMNEDVYILSTEAPGTDGLISRIHLRPGPQQIYSNPQAAEELWVLPEIVR